jgi:hypothetical protein
MWVSIAQIRCDELMACKNVFFGLMVMGQYPGSLKN